MICLYCIFWKNSSVTLHFIVNQEARIKTVSGWTGLKRAFRGRPASKLAEIDPLYVEVILPVSLYGQIKNGQRAQVFPEKPVGGVYDAAVKVVDRVVDGASGTFGVRLQLPNPGYRIPAGIKCRVKFH